MMALKIEKPEDLYRPVANHPVETITNLDLIPIRENGEPLVDLAFASPNVLLKPFGGRQGKLLYARLGVARRLNQAQSWLSQHYPGYRLIIVDAHRDFSDQTRAHMFFRRFLRLRHPTWSAELIREAANKYVAAPDAVAPPPHTTGGAVDIRVMGPDGAQVKMGGRNPFSLQQSHMDYEDLSDEEKRNRQILADAMNSAGFSNYEEEWWHWSYGDSGWVLRSRLQTPAAITEETLQGLYAIYGRIEKPDIQELQVEG